MRATCVVGTYRRWSGAGAARIRAFATTVTAVRRARSLYLCNKMLGLSVFDEGLGGGTGKRRGICPGLGTRGRRLLGIEMLVFLSIKTADAASSVSLGLL